VPRGLPRRHEGRKFSLTRGRGYCRILAILDRLRRGPVLKVQAGCRRVIPRNGTGSRTIERQKLEPNIVHIADTVQLRECSAGLAQPGSRRILSSDPRLAERALVPLLKDERVLAELGAREPRPAKRISPPLADGNVLVV
jgi:hypothetical protein